MSTDGGATLTVLETHTGNPATEYAHPRLMNGDMRYYRVFAINAAGTGRASNAAIATTGSGPAVPANVGADRGDGSLSVTWDAVAGATEYAVQWTSGGDPFTRSRELTVTTNAATVPDLVNGTTYTLRVSAGNAQGDSEWSEPATGMPQVPAPETPENLKVTAGDTTLAVTWDAVPVAAEYTVQWKSGTEEFDSERQLTVTVNTATAPGLVNGTTYTLRVQAANAGGESGWSETATGTPTPLGVPGNMEVTAWDGRVAVCFDEVVGATEYTVQWRTDTEAYSEDRQKTVFETSETMDCGEGRLSTAIPGLANETVHWFRVRASNSWWDEGVQRKDSLWSAEVTATPTATPAAPANLVVTPADGRLDVSWDAVKGADRYTVEWRQSGTVREQEETTHAAALTGLVNGTTYSLRVKAANEVGEGPWSAPARGRPDPLGHPPEVSITLGAGPPVDGALSVRVTFSEAVSGFEDGDLTAGYVGGPDVLVRGFEEEQTGLVYSAMVPAPQAGNAGHLGGSGKGRRGLRLAGERARRSRGRGRRRGQSGGGVRASGDGCVDVDAIREREAGRIRHAIGGGKGQLGVGQLGAGDGDVQRAGDGGPLGRHAGDRPEAGRAGERSALRGRHGDGDGAVRLHRDRGRRERDRRVGDTGQSHAERRDHPELVGGGGGPEAPGRRPGWYGRRRASGADGPLRGGAGSP